MTYPVRLGVSHRRNSATGTLARQARAGLSVQIITGTGAVTPAVLEPGGTPATRTSHVYVIDGV